MDSAAAIVRAIQAASADLGLPVPTDARARHVIGLGLSDALRHAVPELPEEDYPQMVERYRHHYLSNDHELSLFDGTVELIANLLRRGPSAGGGHRQEPQRAGSGAGFSGWGAIFMPRAAPTSAFPSRIRRCSKS
jgi:phosphoglycolate phosphatase